MAKPSKKGGGSQPSSLNQARLLNRIIFGLALFGTLITVHLWIQSERGFSHGCFGLSDPAEVGVVECTAVLQSDAGKLFGISNIVYGFFFFGTIAALSFASILAKDDEVKKLRRASLIVASIGVGYALYLFSYQVFVLSQFCKLCLTTGFTTAVLFGLHAVEWAGKTTPRFELAELVREVGLFILITLIAGMLLVGEVFFVNRIGTLPGVSATESLQTQPDEPHTQSAASDTDLANAESAEAEAAAEADPSEVLAQLQRQCNYDPAAADIPDMDALTRRAPYVGADTASVAMVEFFDPNCPHCKTLHDNTPAIMAEVGGRAKLYYRPYPIWPYSYTQIEALYQAEDAGLFHEMLDAQMDAQRPGGLSVSLLTEIADDIGMDSDQFRRDLNAGKHRSRVNRERAQIGQLGISSVPKLAIEGRFLQGSAINPACIDHMIAGNELGG
jgi:protein-disulfide isomerase/uncharacterized membrane protein